MPSRLELLAEAFPLHYQRIVEETFRQVPTAEAREYLNSQAVNANDALCSAFEWKRSVEGHDYWAALPQFKERR